MNEEVYTKPICKFYKTIYKRMVIWFGYTYPYWLSDMDQQLILTCILRMNMKPSMYYIFINVSIKIRKNNNRLTDVLEEYKRVHPDSSKTVKRKQYYEDNIVRIKAYNKNYHAIKTAFISSGINIFKKCSKV